MTPQRGFDGHQRDSQAGYEQGSCNPGTYYWCGAVSVLTDEGDGGWWRDKDRGGGGGLTPNGNRPRRFVCTW
jgi:hypothetical protein